jgi:hypothetical protein
MRRKLTKPKVGKNGKRNYSNTRNAGILYCMRQAGKKWHVRAVMHQKKRGGLYGKRKACTKSRTYPTRNTNRLGWAYKNCKPRMQGKPYTSNALGKRNWRGWGFIPTVA